MDIKGKTKFFVCCYEWTCPVCHQMHEIDWPEDLVGCDVCGSIIEGDIPESGEYEHK